MIRRSDNPAANVIFTRVGIARLQRLATRAGMSRFKAASPIWGNSPDHRPRPDPLLPAHRHAAAAQAPRLRPEPPAHRRRLAALGDRQGRPPRLARLLQGRLGIGHRPRRPPGRAAASKTTSGSRSPSSPPTTAPTRPASRRSRASSAGSRVNWPAHPLELQSVAPDQRARDPVVGAADIRRRAQLVRGPAAAPRPALDRPAVARDLVAPVAAVAVRPVARACRSRGCSCARSTATRPRTSGRRSSAR